MANEEHVARLKQGVAVWNAWCNESRVHGGVVIRGDFAEADLSRMNLEGANLNEAILIGANLSGAFLGKAILIEAHLLDTNLSDTFLIEADLSRANLTGADLRGALLTEARLSAEDQIGDEHLLVALLQLDGTVAVVDYLDDQQEQAGQHVGERTRPADRRRAQSHVGLEPHRRPRQGGMGRPARSLTRYAIPDSGSSDAVTSTCAGAPCVSSRTRNSFRVWDASAAHAIAGSSGRHTRF